MRFGFLGTGTISDAVIRGICRNEKTNIEAIFISKRNAHIAAKLARDFSCVKIAENNQIIVDNADWVFVALPAAFCESVLRKLRFRSEQKLISFVPNPSCAEILAWAGGDAAVFRAMPLPFIAEHKSVTPIFPADKELSALFGALGGCICAENEKQFKLFMAAGSMMGVYYRFCGLCADWLRQNGLKQDLAETYMAALFAALAEQAQARARDSEPDNSGNKDAKQCKSRRNIVPAEFAPEGVFAVLQREYSTKGGTNEAIAEAFNAEGGAAALFASIEAGFIRIKG